MRWVETRLVTATARLGFPVHRRDTPPRSKSLVGVWAPGERKLASVGMRIRGGITSHGFAINVDPDLDAFRRFTVCGLPDVTMTSLHELAHHLNRPTPTESAVRDAVAAEFEKPPPWSSEGEPRRSVRTP